jgi:cellulose synthase/poly-beta-1,6-N-acetylglucosamine synthase-like glycosyltransferase/spore germination protein YaaH/peptidoglycan/xylan/chitin deacetylase (PgdA/CDA1 family)
MRGNLSTYMPDDSTNQIFQTNSPYRWRRFKWSGRVFFLFIILCITIIVITLSRVYIPALPRMMGVQEKQVLLDSTSSWLFSKSKIGRQYGGFRKFINEKEIYRHGGYPIPRRFRKQNGVIVQADSNFYSFRKFPSGVRAAFFVDWDPQSYSSLEQNISHLNMVIPEWLFLDPNADTLKAKIDPQAYDLMRRSEVKIVPELTNADSATFRGDVVHRILTNPEKRKRLLKDLLSLMEQYNFAGVNVDFEELKEKNNQVLVDFQREIYQKLHSRGFLVSQSVSPFNEDYNLSELSSVNDYVFLMAYDQYSESTGPGPISHQKWIEAAVDQAAKKIPNKKLILAVAGYGYDWKLNKQGRAITAKVVTYQEALNLAKSYESEIDFNNDSYNLDFGYADDDNNQHQVYFTDAATTFNSLRFATEYGLSGVSLWRLGSEDSRMWDFYDRDMTKDSAQRFDFTAFSNVKAMDNDEVVDYEGEGEVLDVIGGPTSGKIVPEIDSSEMLISEEHYDSLPSKWVAKKYGTQDKKKLVLTFDDGPDPVYTPEILDILSKEQVPAAFFVVGLNAENNIPLVKRIFREGHEIGNHTFTHPNIAKVSRKRAILEMEATRLLIECITGHSTIMFRAPYNADFEPQKAEELIPVAIARQKNYLDIGESIDPMDWVPGTTADSIVARVIQRKEELTKQDLSGNIILLHDAGGDSRAATVEALPRIIKYFKDRGYTFTTVSALVGKKKDDLMPPVPKGSGFYLLQLNYLVAEVGYWGSHILFSLFIVFIILSAVKILSLGFIATQENRREKRQQLMNLTAVPNSEWPLVAIIVPAFNEEVNAVSSLQNLLRTEYPKFEVIFIDDGSKDNTYQNVMDAFAYHPKVKVLSKPNGGKASALNYGVHRTNAEFVVCIDADTQLRPDAISRMMDHFLIPQASANSGRVVGAVAGNVKVGNQVNLLTKWQAIEYISSQNFDRKAFAYLNIITVVPGAIGAFRKKAIEEAGGFTSDTLAEDCDLTIRILRCGYQIDNEPKAIAMTEAPETLKMFIKQRFRWSFGVMQTFWKNRDVLFNWNYKGLGWIAMPNIMLFQYIIPFLIPLADFFMIVGLMTGNAAKMGWYYLIFMLVDASVTLLAFSFERERVWRLFWLIPQRLAWRWLMWYVLFKACRRAIKGELQNWGVLKRTGNVKEVGPAVRYDRV